MSEKDIEMMKKILEEKKKKSSEQGDVSKLYGNFWEKKKIKNKKKS